MDPKDVYETLDVIQVHLRGSMLVPNGTLAELLMALTGTHVEEHGGMAGIPTHNPDTAAEARKTVLRWLRDHGYVRRFPEAMRRTGDPSVLSIACQGPNRACRTAYLEGRPVHMLPPVVDVRKHPALVLPTYHFRTVQEGDLAIRQAMREAPMVDSDTDLERFRRAGIPHYLPVGWIDPSRRR